VLHKDGQIFLKQRILVEESGRVIDYINYEVLRAGAEHSNYWTWLSSLIQKLTQTFGT
jgi:hypothetical protein